MPGEDAVNEAAAALRAYDEAGGKVIAHNGRMLEAPIVKQYRAIVARGQSNKNEGNTHA